MCIRADAVDTLEARCRELMVSARGFTVGAGVNEGEIQLLPRPLTLDITPIEGCGDSNECTDLEDQELTQSEQAAMDPPGTLPRHMWSCEATNMSSANRCVETCPTGKDTECSPGAICQDKECVLGPTKGIDPSCTAPLQNFEVRAGLAFTVISSATGYHHPWTADSTGQCVKDPGALLEVGRFHLAEPDCGSDSIISISPNPCHLTSLQEAYIGGDGQPTTRAGGYAVRVRTPGLTFDVADVEIPLTDYIASANPEHHFSPLPSGYAFKFIIDAGFLPHAAVLTASFPQRLVNAPDGSLWVIDSGDDPSTTGPKGQLLHYTQFGLDTNVRLN
jgi:hypothetical protein